MFDKGPLEEHEHVREVYRDRRTLLSEMPLIGWARYPKAAPNFHAHLHPAYEISLIVAGNVTWWAGRSTYEVRRGDIYVTRPNERHGGQDGILPPCELYWLHIQFPAAEPLPGISLEDTQKLAAAFRAFRRRCFRGSPHIADCYQRILAAHQTPGVYSELSARSALHELLVGVIEDHAAHVRRLRSKSAAPSPQIAQALAWIEQRLSEAYQVHEIAAAVGMSTSHFHSCFVREVGFTPADYQNRRRIEAAKELLFHGQGSITGIAHALGFSTSQYFATAFKHLVGMTPRDYRRHMTAAPTGAERPAQVRKS
jgi:AraC-like DNA-binding protein